MIETEGSNCCALDARLRFVDSQADSRLKPEQFLGTYLSWPHGHGESHEGL